MKNSNIFKSRRFKHGSMATLVTIIFVVAVVIVNIIASQILDRMPVSVDLTKDKIYQLTEESIDYAAKIKDKIEILICKSEADLTGSTYGKQATEIISGYAKENSNISVRYVDLLKEPEIASKYAEYKVQDYSIVITTDKRTKVVDMNSFIEEKTDQNTQVKTYFSAAEKLMTSALMYVTDDKVEQVSVLTGHSEVGAVGLTSMLTDNNYEIKEQNIATEEINQDAAMVMIYAPTTDYAPEELKKLDNYLDNGGKFDKNVVYVAAGNQPVLPNLSEFLAEWGLKIGDGIVVETDVANIYDQQGFMFSADYKDNTYTADLRNKTLPYLSFYSRPISTVFEEEGNRTAKILLASPETTFLFPLEDNEKFDVKNAKQESQGIVALGQRLKYEGTDAHISSVLAFGSTMMFDAALVKDAKFNNNEYSINVINKLAGKTESLNIASVSFNADKLAVTQSIYIGITIVFVWAIPLIALALGIVVWLRRRHK